MATVIIEKTGGENEDFLFSHAIIQEESDISNIPQKVDFVSIEKKDSFNFLHITPVENESSIFKKGLVLPQSDYISDLGKGIYLIEEDNVEAIEYLKDYVSEHYGEYDDEDVKILIVTGEYNGSYIECIKGDGHVGYIVAKEAIPSHKINDLVEITVTDFLLDY